MVYDSQELSELISKIKESIGIIDDVKSSLNNDFALLDDLEYSGLSTFKDNANKLSENYLNFLNILEKHIEEMDNIEKEQLSIIEKYLVENVAVNTHYSGGKVAIDKIVLDRTNTKDILSNYINEVIPTFSYEIKKETLNNILNDEDDLISIITDENESDVFVYQLNNILKDKYDIRLDKLTKSDEIVLQKEFLEKISDNDTNIFSDSNSILSGLSYYKDVAKKNNISISDLIFDNDELFIQATKDIYENIGDDLLTEEESSCFKKYIDSVANSNNISSLDLLNNNKYISIIKGGINYEG